MEPVAVDRTVMERLRAVPGAWDLVVDLNAVVAAPTPEMRAARFARKIAPRLAAIAADRDDLRERLEIGWDDLPPLSDEVPVDKRERMWLGWLREYETLCTVLAVAEEVRIGKAIVWEEDER